MGKGTRQKVTHRVPIFMSQASGLNPEAVDPKNTLLSYNFYLQNGMLKKIPGSELYVHSTYGSSPIPWMAEFQRRLIWQLGQNLLIETAEGSQVEELLASDFDTDALDSDTWEGAIYLANGKQLRLYDGTQVGELGLPPPGGGTVPRQIFSTRLVGTGSLGNGNYKYTLTFFDENTQTESPPTGSLPNERGLFNVGEFDADTNPTGWLTAPLTVGGGLSAAAINFSVAYAGYVSNTCPERATHAYLYRSFDSGSGFSDYRFVTAFERGGDSFSTALLAGYSDTTAQANLGEVMLPEEKIPPPTRSSVVDAGAAASAVGPKFVRFWRDSLFLFGAEFPEFEITDATTGATDKNFGSQSILYGSDTNLPDYYPFNWSIGSGDGQAQTGIAVVNDILCIFKERSVYTLVGTSLSNFVPKIQDETRGCIAPGSIQETPYGAIFLSSAGVARFKGTGTSEIISDKILDEIQDINRAALGVITSSYDPDQEVYTLYVPRGTSTQNTRALMFSLKDSGWTVMERSRFISSAAIIPKENGPQVSIVGTAAGGLLLNVSSREVVTDYDGERITARYRSSEFDFGNREQQKRLTWLYVKAQCAINYFIDIAVYADDGQSAVYEQENINSETFVSYYAASQTDPDGAVYDTDRYMGPQTAQRIKIPIYGIGRDFFVEVTERSMNDARHSFDLLSIEVEAVLLEQ